ncbi:hypothetical protein H2201_001290 [Coniosporium apollinis]|uniref:VPS9 domain-containing protein n=1 Tax=Coniosporium apollinis TaxID=61459 RepID=A0ABQ9P6Z2_9PEZI|nr:hypothetical protein H2201_001290 [Coniosporium apollinis]
MHPLNPFLRAFFRSTLPAQCSPVQHHILLVPTTEFLLNSRDRDTNAAYADLAGSEDFLASHVLRVPGGVGPSTRGKDGAFRDNRGKAKQYTTANGRTVIIKDTFVYSNKGFKSLNQAQLVNDAIFYPDTFDAQPWLVYYITKPLIGSPEPVLIKPATLEPAKAAVQDVSTSIANGSASNIPRKKEVKSFGELLNHFPMIARQMQPGLERLFKEFGREVEKPLPALPPALQSTNSLRRSSMSSSTESLSLSLHSSLSNGAHMHYSALELDENEDFMRRSLETAVTGAIDLFQEVDKQQLSLLGATTDLTGPIVERMIERYVTEQVHDSVLFPKVREIRRVEDMELDSNIRQMVDVDIAQVGIAIDNNSQVKRELTVRVSKGVEAFKKMGVAGSPQEMMDVLVATQKAITMPQPSEDGGKVALTNGVAGPTSEKKSTGLTINADTLVSLLLVVVIRSSVRHLKARLSYMKHFIFVEDVESGEMGYALSTYEAVLSYLSSDPGGLRRASRRNRKLWQATRSGNIADIQAVLEPNRAFEYANGPIEDTEVTPNDAMLINGITGEHTVDQELVNGMAPNGDSVGEESRRASVHIEEPPPTGDLAHVFPFQRMHTPPQSAIPRPKIKKRVSMQSRSTSSSSGYSMRSRANTVDSPGSGTEGDTSIERLSRTHSSGGESVLMMAVESGQQKSLQYLLSLTQYYPLEVVLEDCDNDGTTLLSTAIQLGHSDIVDTLLDFIAGHAEGDEVLKAYVSRQDNKGRCAAHYLFNQPRLIARIGHFLPWRLKDKNGQTPLFALCRSYDHEEYRSMVDAALTAATESQADGEPLHLDDHIDGKGNTLLHIVNDPQIATRLLYRCDADSNAANDKHFTPLMVASKYGRTDLVRVLFGDARVDLHAKDLRGLSAVELAKDDEVRNRIDDLVLLSNPPAADRRITTVVRSFFVEDGTIRLVIKSGAPNDNSTITVTTCRRSLTDFENLARLLAMEQPASWLPSVANFPSPFLIPSKPSRVVLRDIQVKLDGFLKNLLSHSTFSTHEMVWEFFLVPEIEHTMLAERSQKKAEARVDRVKDEYDPISDVREVELFVQHARESVRSLHHATRSVIRRVNRLRFAHSDFYDAATMASSAISTLTFLPQAHITALDRYVKTLAQPEFPPLAAFYYNIHAISTTVTAILTALARPASLIGSMSASQKAIDRHNQSLRRSDRWPLGLLDDTRHRMQRDAGEKVEKAQQELESLGKELRYTQQTVAGELAAWQESRVRMGRMACRELARKMVVVERARLEGMRRAVRGLGLGKKDERGEGGGAQRDSSRASSGQKA